MYVCMCVFCQLKTNIVSINNSILKISGFQCKYKKNMIATISNVNSAKFPLSKPTFLWLFKNHKAQFVFTVGEEDNQCLYKKINSIYISWVLLILNDI